MDVLECKHCGVESLNDLKNTKELSLVLENKDKEEVIIILSKEIYKYKLIATFIGICFLIAICGLCILVLRIKMII